MTLFNGLIQEIVILTSVLFYFIPFMIFKSKVCERETVILQSSMINWYHRGQLNPLIKTASLLQIMKPGFKISILIFSYSLYFHARHVLTGNFFCCQLKWYMGRWVAPMPGTYQTHINVNLQTATPTGQRRWAHMWKRRWLQAHKTAELAS